MKTSGHPYTDQYGYKGYNYINMQDEDTVIFSCEPQLEYDVTPLYHQFKYFDRTKLPFDTYQYSCSYMVKDGAIFLKRVQYRGKPIIKRASLPGAELHLINPTVNRLGRVKNALISYEFYGDGQRVNYTGCFLAGQEFIVRYWPKNDIMEPVPFFPQVYKKVYKIYFENGKEVRRELIATNDQNG